MARNIRNGRGRRGAIRGRTQFKLPNGHYAKRDRQTGEIISVKADLKPYKGIVIEKTPPTIIPASSPTPAARARRDRLVLPVIPGRAPWQTRQGRSTR
jgi:hypothetical protein